MSRIFLMAAATAMTISASLPVRAAPMMPSPVAQESSAQQVQYRRWHGGPGYRHYGYRRGYGGGGYGTGAAVLGGLAAGAIIGGAIASSQAQAANAQAYCAQRFRSYDPASGTYLGTDGYRHPCP
ncbi:BA14K family protein [Bradyrhizobium sp. Ai1a-2]|uniref:BA14K family protein n=1 Tax=Bradyrhizobium sp. Ai1a-2 TaxID=196490 RepID=UPI0005BC7967|nr:BA14K family protein [Bradyrhizobium sp. Ai1a-2]